MNILDQIRSYVFVPSGELIRGAEVAVATAVIGSLSGVTDWGEWRMWLTAAAVAGATALLGFAKGKLPSATP